MNGSFLMPPHRLCLCISAFLYKLSGVVLKKSNEFSWHYYNSNNKMLSQGHRTQGHTKQEKNPYWYKVIIKSISGTFELLFEF